MKNPDDPNHRHLKSLHLMSNIGINRSERGMPISRGPTVFGTEDFSVVFQRLTK